MNIHDIDVSRLPPVERIDPVHREQIQRIIREQTQGAATDAEALRVVERLIEEAGQGQTWDEEGNRTTIHVQSESDFWSESQIEAAAASQPNNSSQPDTKQQFIAIGFVVVALFLVTWLFIRSRRPAPEITPVVVVEANAGEEFGNGSIDESSVTEINLLGLSDNLGVRTRIGQPATIELLDSRTGSSVTLSVINTPINDRTMPIVPEIAEGQLVAEWVAGTIVNYVVGIPVAVMEQSAVGNTVLVRTDTGATYSFTCTEQLQKQGQESEVFFQDKPGITLFPLPSPRSPVPILWCPYDPTREEIMLSGGITHSRGDQVEIGNIRFSVTDMVINHTLDGQLSLELTGNIQASTGFGTVVMGLNTDNGRYSPRGDQFQATETEQRWLAQFLLPANLVDNQLYLDVRSPTGGSLVFDLGRLTDPVANLQVSLGSIIWDKASQEIEVNIYFTNNGVSSVRLTNTDFSATQGGVNVLTRIIEPTTMPVLAGGNRQTMITIRLLPAVGQGPVNLQILSTVWEINGNP